MKEAFKTNRVRGPDFAGRYLQGRVLDIGAGGDLVCAGAQSFDVEDGDANHIERHLPAASFDTVHSSHCLEHMHDPVQALRGWWSLVRPGGYLVLVVPDEDLYEQGVWPSRFNADHKATFRLDGPGSWSPVSHEVRALCTALPGAQLVSVERQDQGFDRTLLVPPGVTPQPRIGQPWKLLLSLARRVPVFGPGWVAALRRHLVPKGHAIDQTNGAALAQIQAIVRKSAG